MLKNPSISNPGEFGTFAINHLRCNPKFRELIAQTQKITGEIRLKEVLSSLEQVTEFTEVNKVSSIKDIVNEDFLTKLRRSLLLFSLEKHSVNTSLRFVNCLALHCYQNEYIFNVTEEEKEHLFTLEDEIKKTLL